MYVSRKVKPVNYSSKVEYIVHISATKMFRTAFFCIIRENSLKRKKMENPCLHTFKYIMLLTAASMFYIGCIEELVLSYKYDHTYVHRCHTTSKQNCMVREKTPFFCTNLILYSTFMQGASRVSD